MAVNSNCSKRREEGEREDVDKIGFQTQLTKITPNISVFFPWEIPLSVRFKKQKR